METRPWVPPAIAELLPFLEDALRGDFSPQQYIRGDDGSVHTQLHYAQRTLRIGYEPPNGEERFHPVAMLTLQEETGAKDEFGVRMFASAASRLWTVQFVRTEKSAYHLRNHPLRIAVERHWILRLLGPASSTGLNVGHDGAHELASDFAHYAVHGRFAA